MRSTMAKEKQPAPPPVTHRQEVGATIRVRARVPLYEAGQFIAAGQEFETSEARARQLGNRLHTLTS